MNIDYTLWPNADGNLGNIKVQIPTGIGDDKWPEGDALVGNFVYKDGKLAGFVDTKALTINNSKSTTINYDYIDIELPNIGESDLTISRGARSKYFTIKYGTTLVIEEPEKIISVTAVSELSADELSTIRSSRKIKDNVCYDNDLNEICKIDTSALKDGTELLVNCNAFEEFNSDLSSLTNGTRMFYNASYGEEPYSNGYDYGGALFVTTGYMKELTNASEMFASEYKNTWYTPGPEFAMLVLKMTPYSSANPCKITNITNMVNNRGIADETTFDNITNICKFAKVSGEVSIGEIQGNGTGTSYLKSIGWSTSKTRVADPDFKEATTTLYISTAGGGYAKLVITDR